MYAHHEQMEEFIHECISVTRPEKKNPDIDYGFLELNRDFGDLNKILLVNMF